MGTGTICPDSVIRNNRVETNRDVSIAAENAPNTVIEGNECRTGAGYPNSIEYRWPDTTGVVITGNRTNGKIVARDGATAAKVEDNMILND